MGQTYIKGYKVLYDDEDQPYIDGWVWHIHKTNHSLYLRGYKKGERKDGLKYMHRVIAGAIPGMDVDHANGDGLDNRRANLRVCTRSQNNANRHRVQSKTSRFKGVHFDKQTGKWRSEVTINGKRYRLGRFETQESAVAAYYNKAKELFSEYAKLASK